MTQTLDALLAAPPATQNVDTELLTTKDTPRKADQYAEIPVSVIRAGDNPRTLFDSEALEDLATSIREFGVLEPLIVRQAPPGSPFVEVGYEIVAGERRFRAAQLAGLTYVPCVIRDVRTDRDAQALALIENLHRVDLNCMETAAGYRRLGDLGYDQARIAGLIHRSISVVSNTTRLLKLPEKVQDYLRAGRLSEGHGLALLPCLGFVGEAEMLALQAADGGLSVKALRAEVERRHPKPVEAPAPALPMEVPETPSGAANDNSIFAAPHPEPLTAQDDNTPASDGDLTDEQWEASARLAQTEIEEAPDAQTEVQPADTDTDGAGPEGAAPDAQPEDATDTAGEAAENTGVGPDDSPPADLPAAVTPDTPNVGEPAHADPAPTAPKAAAQPQPAKAVAAPAPAPSPTNRVMHALSQEDDDWLWEQDLTLPQAITELRRVWDIRPTPQAAGALRLLTDDWTRKYSEVTPAERLRSILVTRAIEAGLMAEDDNSNSPLTEDTAQGGE
jgi:ParB/RepB/Spo0J family partition protein